MNNWKHGGVVTNNINVIVFESSTHTFEFEKITDDEIISITLSCDCMTYVQKGNIFEFTVNFRELSLNKTKVDSTKLIFVTLKNEDGVYNDILTITSIIKKND